MGFPRDRGRGGDDGRTGVWAGSSAPGNRTGRPSRAVLKSSTSPSWRTGHREPFGRAAAAGLSGPALVQDPISC